MPYKPGSWYTDPDTVYSLQEWRSCLTQNSYVGYQTPRARPNGT